MIHEASEAFVALGGSLTPRAGYRYLVEGNGCGHSAYELQVHEVSPSGDYVLSWTHWHETSNLRFIEELGPLPPPKPGPTPQVWEEGIVAMNRMVARVEEGFALNRVALAVFGIFNTALSAILIYLINK